jgi:predicted nucleotidyltransferase
MQDNLDVLVEFSETVGLFKFIQLEDFLSRELNVKVDLVMKDGLKPLIKEPVLKEVVYL